MEKERITSSQNPLLRHIQKLRLSRAYRNSCGQFVGDGFKLLEEALRWSAGLSAVILAEGQSCPPLPDGVRCVEVPPSLMERISGMKTPQGVLFVAALPAQEFGRAGCGMLLLDRIQDPGNLGTILRTADAFDVPVLLTNGCADPFSEKTLRASMGAVLRTPPRSAPLETVLAQCRQDRIPIAVTALSEQAADIRTQDLRECLIAIGSEGQGVCDDLLRAAERQLIIPMQPRCESLNAAVAAAIVMWQMKYGQ